MLRMIDGRPHFEFEWGFDGSHEGKVLPFSVKVEYAGAGYTRQLLTSFEASTVVAHSDGDELAFAKFKSELAEALRLCRAPLFMKWQNATARPSFRAAEKLVLNSHSFEDQFSATPLLTFDGKFVLFRQALWTKRAELSREDCRAFLEEYYRRETQRLGRITPEQFFNQNARPALDRRPIPESVRHEVWRRDEGKCTRCGSRVRLEFDHIIPIAFGGGSTARNLQLLCEECNRSKGATLGNGAMGNS